MKDQASNSSDEQCEEEEEDDDEEDSYYDEDGPIPAAMVMSTEKTSGQSTISNSGATLSIRNAKSVSKKSKPVINVRAVIMFLFALSFFFTFFWVVRLSSLV